MGDDRAFQRHHRLGKSSIGPDSLNLGAIGQLHSLSL